MIPLRSIALIACLTATGVSAAVPRAEQAWRAGDYRAAFMAAAEAAENGDPDAQFILGEAYRLGKGTYVNVLAAEVWYFRAAQQGNVGAAAELGAIYATEHRTDDAIRWLRMATDHGDAGAQGTLAALLYNAAETDRDRSEALAMMARSAAHGSAQAEAQLARVQAATGIAVAPKVPVEAMLTPAAKGQPVAVETPVATARLAEKLPVVATARLVEKSPVVAMAPIAVRLAALPDVSPNFSMPIAAVVPGSKTVAANRPPVFAASLPVSPHRVAWQSANAPWRIQIGAYRTPAAALHAWTLLSLRIPALRTANPLMERAGLLTRVRTGTGSYAQALTLCRMVRDARWPCYVATNHVRRIGFTANSRFAARLPAEGPAKG